MILPPLPLYSVDPSRSAVDALTDDRKRREFEQHERDRVRALQYEELRSEFSSTEVRVRAWEKLHGLRLPMSSSHPVLHVISAATGIPIAALHDEQQARRAARTPRPATSVEATNAPSGISPDSSEKQQG